MHGMDKAAGRVRPSRGSFPGNGVGCRTAVGHGFLGRIVIRITRHQLPHAIDEELVEFETGRSLGLKDTILIGRPLQREWHAAAQDRFAFVRGAVNDGGSGRAGVFAVQHQRLVEVVNPVLHHDRDAFFAGLGPGQLAGGFERFDGSGRRARLLIGAGRRDVDFERGG